MNDTNSTNDIVAITQLVLRERQGRDRAWWTQMEECFHPESRVVLSWINGTGREFVAGSRRMSDAGFRPVHRPSPPVVHVQGDRGVLELPVSIETRFPIEGVDVDLVSFSRLLYQVERFEGQWKIKVLNSIYERDTLIPVVPGTTVKIDMEKISTYRKAYQFLAYHISRGGNTMPDNLYGDDQPDKVNALYDTAFQWMRQE